MLMPRLYTNRFFDDFFDFPMTRDNGAGIMQTDIRENENDFEVTVNLPGFSKEEVKGELKDGYLVISAETDHSNDEKDADGKYIRRERYTGSCSRSFYVGEHLKREDIQARFENGTLKMMIPKKQALPREEEKKYIAIAG